MKQQSVVSLDPISVTRKKQDSVLSRFFKTSHYGGKSVKRTDEIGHYLFCGKQRSGKSVSCLWYAEYLTKKYKRQHKRVVFYSNMHLGHKITKETLSRIIRGIDYEPDTIHIIVVDEIQSYFPKDCNDKFTKQLIDNLTGDFSQLAKKNIFVLSTAQVYGRLNKALREQCLYMVNCRRSKISNRIVNDFISGDDIICDDLGRWAGIPKYIKVHGLPKMDFDTHLMITE